MVRQDNDFVLHQLLVENNKRWLKMTNYYYKGGIYSNYLFFLDSYCVEYECPKCKEKLVELFKELGLSKNQHKKKTIKYIRWKK